MQAFVTEYYAEPENIPTEIVQDMKMKTFFIYVKCVVKLLTRGVGSIKRLRGVGGESFYQVLLGTKCRLY
jgi:hypothetical protein